MTKQYYSGYPSESEDNDPIFEVAKVKTFARQTAFQIQTAFK